MNSIYEKQLKVQAEDRRGKSAEFSQAQQIMQGDLYNHDQYFYSEERRHQLPDHMLDQVAQQQLNLSFLSKRMDSSEEFTLFQSTDVDYRMIQPVQAPERQKGSSNLTTVEEKKAKIKLKKKLYRQKKRREMSKQKQAARIGARTSISGLKHLQSSYITDHSIGPSPVGHFRTTAPRSTLDPIGVREGELHPHTGSSFQHEKECPQKTNSPRKNLDTIGVREEDDHPHVVASSRLERNNDVKTRNILNSHLLTFEPNSTLDSMGVREEELYPQEAFSSQHGREFPQRINSEMHPRKHSPRRNIDVIGVREEDDHPHNIASARHRMDHGFSPSSSSQTHPRTSTFRSSLDLIRVREEELHLHNASSPQHEREFPQKINSQTQSRNRSPRRRSLDVIGIREEDEHRHAVASSRHRRDHDFNLSNSSQRHSRTIKSRNSFDLIRVREEELHPLNASSPQHDREFQERINSQTQSRKRSPRRRSLDVIGVREEDGHPHAVASSRHKRVHDFNLSNSSQRHSRTIKSRNSFDLIRVKEEELHPHDVSSPQHEREFAQRTNFQIHPRKSPPKRNLDMFGIREEDDHPHVVASSRHKRDHDFKPSNRSQTHPKTCVREEDVYSHFVSSSLSERDNEYITGTSKTRRNLDTIRVREKEVHPHADSSSQNEFTPSTVLQTHPRTSTSMSTLDMIRVREEEVHLHSGSSFQLSQDHELTLGNHIQTDPRTSTSRITLDLIQLREEVHPCAVSSSLYKKTNEFATKASAPINNLLEDKVLLHTSSSRPGTDHEFTPKTSSSPQTHPRSIASQSTFDHLNQVRGKEVHLQGGFSSQHERDHEFTPRTSPQAHLRTSASESLDLIHVREHEAHPRGGSFSQDERKYEFVQNTISEVHSSTSIPRRNFDIVEGRKEEVHQDVASSSQKGKCYESTPKTGGFWSTFAPNRVREIQVHSQAGSSSQHEKDHRLAPRTNSVSNMNERSKPIDNTHQHKKTKTNIPKQNHSNKKGDPQNPVRPQTQKKTTVNSALQVVIMGSEEGAPLSQEETQFIRRLLIEEIEMRISEPHPRRMPLVFENSGRQTKSGWFLITCSNEETRDWLLDWVPPINHRFVVRCSSQAPWPSKIVIGLGADNIEPDRLLKFLEYQNDGLTDVDQWIYLGCEGNPAQRRAIFRVPRSTVTWLEAHEWRIRFELFKLSVWRAPSHSAKPSSSRKIRGRGTLHK